MNKKCDIPIKSCCAKKVSRCRAGGLISKNFLHSLEIVQIFISMALLLFLAIDREKVKGIGGGPGKKIQLEHSKFGVKS